MASTPLRSWLNEHHLTITGFAKKLKVSRGRAQHWVKRSSAPHGQLLLRVIKMTGLKAQELMPSKHTIKKRRLHRDRLVALQLAKKRKRKAARKK